MHEITIAPEDPGQPDVAALVRALDHYMAGLYPAESVHSLDIETLRCPEVRFFVARRESIALGCAALVLHGRDYGEVKRVYVAPAARGLSLGHLLVAQLQYTAFENGIGHLKLETGIHQPQALGLFKSSGFSICGPFGDYPKDDPNSVFMEKTVSASNQSA